jgi:DNA-nicking Smr family endonuclease
MAAKAIFRKRNSLSDLLEGRVDLHGLHASEALDCLEELLPLFQRAQYSTIKVVTGTGHHTAGPHQGKSRLNPTVRDYLAHSTRFKFQDVRDNLGYCGGFLVQI